MTSTFTCCDGPSHNLVAGQQEDRLPNQANSRIAFARQRRTMKTKVKPGYRPELAGGPLGCHRVLSRESSSPALHSLQITLKGPTRQWSMMSLWC